MLSNEKSADLNRSSVELPRICEVVEGRYSISASRSRLPKVNDAVGRYET